MGFQGIQWRAGSSKIIGLGGPPGLILRANLHGALISFQRFRAISATLTHSPYQNIILRGEKLQSFSKSLRVNLEFVIANGKPRLWIQGLSDGVVLILISAAVELPTVV